MQTLFLALATSAIVFTTGTAHVPVSENRYCIQGDEFQGGAGECSFTTFQQCQATASGRLAYCGTNPSFSNVVQPDRRSHHRQRGT
jgi:hypothetical protein